MKTLDYVLLAVADTLASATLYDKLLGQEPVQKSPGFVLYVTPIGLKLGLWQKDEMTPLPGAAGGSELCFSLASRAEVDALHEDWKALGLAIAQTPRDLDFGYTFVALDPDGHKLRAFVRADDPR